MINYTEDKLREQGYKIENAKITSVDLSMADHGCLTLRMVFIVTLLIQYPLHRMT